MKIILTCCLALLSAPLFAAGVPQNPHISVSGQGTVRVVPDVLTIHLSVNQVGSEIDRAKRAVDRTTASAIDIARQAGIDKHDITSTQIRITPRYENHDDERELTGYDVRRQLMLTLRDTDQYEALLKRLVAAGVNGINGVSRSYSHPEELRDKAYSKAVADARAKAEKLAKLFHAGLGQVYAITEQSSPQPRPLLRHNVRFAAAAKSSAFEPGTIDVKARVQAVFLLKP